MNLIGLHGLAGSGKDTVADYLVKQYGYKKIAFAEPLKQGLNAMFGWSMTDWDNREWKETTLPEYGFSPRKAIQTLGTDWGREINQDLWLLIAQNRIKQSDCPVVVSDVRFENEADMIRKQGGTVVHIVRETEAVEAHSSEAGIAVGAKDKIIYNEGHLLDVLWAKVEVMLETLDNQKKPA